jgi:cytoskeletal protein CcmA (bactofilin family)
MFGKKAATKNTIDSLIGATMRLEGNVSFSGGLRIDGHVHGDVVSSDETGGLLVVGERGRIDGNIVVGHLIVNGTVQGAMTVAGIVELQSKAKISGELRYRSLELQRGAVVEGIVSHVDGDLVRADLRLGAVKESQPGSLQQLANPAKP